MPLGPNERGWSLKTLGEEVAKITGSKKKTAAEMEEERQKEEERKREEARRKPPEWYK